MTPPESHLLDPVAAEPIPSSLDGVMNLPALTSVTFYIAKFSNLVGLPTTADLGDWVAGDWERVARAADACRNLGQFSTELASEARRELGTLEATWHGNAAGAASDYFSRFADQLDSNGRSFAQIATQLEQTTIGVHQAAKAIGALVDLAIDLGIAFALKSSALVASAATGVGAAAAVVTSPALVALVVKGIKVVNDILTVQGRASALCAAFVGAVAPPLATLKGFSEMSVPAPYDNRQVT